MKIADIQAHRSSHRKAGLTSRPAGGLGVDVDEAVVRRYPYPAEGGIGGWDSDAAKMKRLPDLAQVQSEAGQQRVA